MNTFEWSPPGPAARAYYKCNDPISIIQGPVRSGKTLTSFMRVLRHMMEQAPSRDGVRRTRWVFARRTYPELEGTTFKAWTELFPEGEPKEGGFGKIKHTPPKVYYFKFNDVEAEIHFMAFENADDVDKLKSMEITAFFVNELQFFDRAVFDVLRERCSWPDPFKQGVSPTWLGGFGDMNAPMSTHWVSIIRGDVPIPPYISADDRPAYEVPRDKQGRALWSFFVQPPGLIEVKDAFGGTKYEVNRGQGKWTHGVLKGEPMPAAENLHNLERIKPDYYLEEAKGKPKLYVETQILGRPAAHKGGKPVHPDYDDDRHYFDGVIKADPNHLLWIGLDFGLHFSAVIGQLIDSQWRILSEIYLEGVTNQKQAQFLRAHLHEEYPDHMVAFGDETVSMLRIYGDPSGDFGNRSGQNDFDVFRANGLRVLPAPGGNRFEPKEGREEHGSFRKSAMDHVLITDSGKGRPGIMVTKPCPLLRDGLRSGYVWEMKDDQGESRIKEKVVKNVYSHVVEAAQYMLLGGGAGKAAINMTGMKKRNLLSEADVFDRGQRSATHVFRRR